MDAIWIMAASLALAAGPEVSDLTASADRVALYERVTLSFALDRAYDNPYDPEQIRVDARVQTPSGREWDAPGCYVEPFTRRLEGEREVLEPAGPGRYEVRLSFMEPGEHRVALRVEDADGVTECPPITVSVEAADAPGFIRRHAEDTRYFVTDRGETYFPIGANVCWDGPRGVSMYEEWLPRYAEQGGNWLRVWLSPHWVTFAMNTRESGYDRVDQRSAWRLDEVLALSERLDMRMMAAIDSFNIASTNKRFYGQYDEAPYARANGGPLDAPEEYFTDAEMLRSYRNRLRYLVARYGYSTHLFAWEFWNEVDGTTNYDSETVAAWHAEMARRLRALDPWDHLIGTSFAHTPGDPRVDGLPEMDFVQSHSYNLRDLALAFGEHRERKEAARTRPHFHGEFGTNSGASSEVDDPAGIHLHNALFSSPGQMHAGAPMSWYWDSYIHPNNLYPIFGAFARWINGFDFVAQQARPMTAQFGYADPEAERPATDLVIQPTEVSWDPSPANQPARVTVDAEGSPSGDLPLAGILHGVGNHPALHNPVTFLVEPTAPCVFSIAVGDVSEHGGANLRIVVDGEVVLAEEYPSPEEPDAEAMVHYQGVRQVTLAPGRHTVEVVNDGKDWFYVREYRFSGLARPSTPPLRAYGVSGRDQALLWVQNARHTWYEANRDDYAPVPVEDAFATVEGLAPGAWRIEQWDTQRGEVIRAWSEEASEAGALRIALPAISWDAAYRFHRE